MKAIGSNSLRRSPPHKYSGATIYVTRILNTKENLPSHQHCWLGMAKPCPKCMYTLYQFNIKKIKYTDIINDVNVLCEMVINQ